MMRNEVIDPFQSTTQERRRLLRLLGPFFGVVLVVGIIALAAFRIHQITRNNVIVLSQKLLQEQQRLISREVSDYLAPAPAAATIAQYILTQPITDAPPRVFLDYGRSVLQHFPQVESFFLANDAGTFWYIGRDAASADGGIEWAHRASGTKRLSHIFLDKNASQTLRTSSEAVSYDPRTRPWYQAALAHPEFFWAEPFAVAKTKQIFVTTSSKIILSNKHSAVFAVNLSLNRLSKFLETLRIGRNDNAMIVDTDGHVIAKKALSTLAEKSDWHFDAMRLDRDAEPVFSRGLSLFNIYGTGVHLVNVKKRTWILIIASLEKIHPGWILMLDVPLDDYDALTKAAGREGFIFPLIIVLMTVILAASSVRQNRTSERLRRELRLLHASRNEETSALERVTAASEILDPSRQAPILTRLLSHLIAARGVSLWRLIHQGQALFCEDALLTSDANHAAGFELSRHDFPAFFDQLDRGSEMVCAPGATNEALRHFYRGFVPNASKSLGAFPIHAQGRIIGVILIEYASSAVRKSPLVRLFAQIIGLRFSLIAAHEANHSDVTEVPPQTMRPQAEGISLFRALRSAERDAAFPAGLYPMVAVACIIFERGEGADPLDEISPFQNMLAQLRQLLDKNPSIFAQLRGRHVILIDGLDPHQDRHAIARIADLLLALRERIARSRGGTREVINLRMGVDAGPTLGAQIGEGPDGFALWGGAYDHAATLARTVPSGGAIQVSETVYEMLREGYLFRPRGSFYRIDEGIKSAYILAARQ